jgi:hypothetical protein
MTISVILGGLSSTASAQLTPGDILVIDENAAAMGGNRGTLFRVDPDTGSRTALSIFSNADQGPLGRQPQNLAVEATGTILVIDLTAGTNSRGALFRVNPATGSRTLLSDFGNAAQGPLGTAPTGVAVEAAGTILVIDQHAGTNLRGALFQVHPTTGTRTLLSDFGNAAQGALGINPTGVTVEVAGTILVIDRDEGTLTQGALFRVDPATGNRDLLSDFGNAEQGPKGSNPTAVAMLLNEVEPPPPVHDLAVTRITAPQTVTLTATKPQLIKPVTVQLQNRSPHDETIPNLATLRDVLSLTVSSLGSCPPPDQVLKNPGLPKTLKPKKTLNVVFDVTFDCANDPAKGARHIDYSYSATVNHEALDGEADTHPGDDSCPRDPLGMVPNPDGTINDQGCAEEVTDVVQK